MTADILTTATVLAAYVVAMAVTALAFWHLWH